MDEPTMNENEAEHVGAEAVAAEVEYIESEKLDDLEDVDKSFELLLANLETKDWVLLCEILNNVLRFSIYHKEILRDILENVISLLVNSLKNPRTAVCKTTFMTCSDIFKEFGDDIINSLDPLGAEGIKEYGIDKLVKIASSQLSDQLPESREAVRTLLLELQTAYEKFPVLAPEQDEKMPFLSPEQDEKLSILSPEQDEKIPVLPLEQDESSKEPQVLSWEQFCESKLPKLSAEAVLRVTNIPREGLASEGRKRRLSPSPSPEKQSPPPGKRTKINDGLSPPEEAKIGGLSASLPPPKGEHNVTTPEHPPPPEGDAPPPPEDNAPPPPPPLEIQERSVFQQLADEVKLVSGLHYYCSQSKERPYSPLNEKDFEDLHKDYFNDLYPTIGDLKQKVDEMESRFWRQEAIVEDIGVEQLLVTLDPSDEHIYRQSKRIWGDGD